VRLNVNRLWCHLRRSCIQNEDINSRVSQQRPLKWGIQVAHKSQLPESSLLLSGKQETSSKGYHG